MKGVSMWQPWASAVALGIKGPETRGWSTKYRGDLVIHAAQRWTREQREFAAVERALGRLPARLPLGALICVVRLVDVVPTDKAILSVSPIEKLYGDYSSGRFAWIFEDIRPLPDPIGYKGAQGFFNIPDDTLPAEFRSRVLL